MKKHLQKQRKNFLYNVGMHGRIFIYLLAFAVSTLLLLWVFQIVYLDDFYEGIKKDHIKTAAQNISLSLGEEDMEAHVEEIAVEYNICADVYLLHHNSGVFFGMEKLISVDLLGDCIIHHLGTQEIAVFYHQAAQAAEAGENGHMEIYSRLRFGTDYDSTIEPDEGMPKSMVYSLITRDSEDNTYLLLLNSSITPVAATVSTLMVQLRFVSIVVLVLAVAFSFIIARRLSRPIIQLHKAAGKLAKGDLTVNFPGTGYKEIADLADTLNYAGAEMARTDKLQKELIANISHDIRTPLTMIGGYAEYMRDFPDEDHSESIQVIIDETQRLRELVNDILDNSRIMSGVSTMNKQVFDINASVAAFVSNYDMLLEPRGCHALFIAPEKELLVNADEKRILQALSNMMNNAAAHIGKDKQIKVQIEELAPPTDSGRHLRRSKNTATAAITAVRISIIDNGCGIDSKDLPHIWERYYHADSSAGTHGSGLGLSIVRGIMELHNAHYGVESSPGKGSTFWFELPVVKV